MFAIALDGPAGAGKSTVAKKAAKCLGIHYVDTGAMYRTLAYGMLQNGVDIRDEEAVRQALHGMEVRIRYEDGMQKMFIGTQEVTDCIRTPEVGEATSTIAVYRAVRDKLLKLQRDLAAQYDVIMDGRDIGTVVLPAAEVKIFLTASPQARAKRRFLENQQKGISSDYDQLVAEIAQRDRQDMERVHSPLRQAEDAVLLDTTALDFVQSEDALLHIIRERTGL